METKHRHSSHAILLNLFACLAVVSLALCVAIYGFFQFRAKQEEAKQIEGFARIGESLIKAQGDYWKQIEKAEKQESSSTSPQALPPSSEPPPLLPKVETP